MQKKEDKNLCLIVLNPEQLMKKGLQVIWLIWWSSQSITRSCLHTELGNSHFIVWKNEETQVRLLSETWTLFFFGFILPFEMQYKTWRRIDVDCIEFRESIARGERSGYASGCFLQCFSHVEQDKIQCATSRFLSRFDTLRAMAIGGLQFADLQLDSRDLLDRYVIYICR
jgi:hypothetical protein